MDSLKDKMDKGRNEQTGGECRSCEVIDRDDARLCCFPMERGPVTNDGGLLRFPMPSVNLPR